MNIENLSSIQQQSRNELKTSNKYSFIPTTRVLGVLADHGWQPFKAQQKNVRIPENQGFQTHIVRLRNETITQIINGKEYLPEIVLKNSHMGTCAFELMAGIFRIVCTNGLVAGETFESYKIRHVGYTDDAVNDAAIKLVEQLPLVSERVESFRTITLNQNEKTAFAKAAIEMTFDNDKWAIAPESLLTPRRHADAKSDLWTVFNTIQENVIKGGMRARNSEGRRMRTRGVKNIDRDVKLNRGLWVLAEEMAKLKGSSVSAS